MSFPFFIAKRLYSSEGKGGNTYSRPAVRIAQAGIAIGVAVMIVSMAIVMGFKREITEKVTGFGSHIQVLSLTQTQDRVLLPVVTTDSLTRIVGKIHGINHIQRFATTLGMLKTEEDFCGITFKGLPQEYDTTFLSQCIVNGTLPRFNDKESSNQILISQSLSRSLHLNVGDRVFAYFVGKESMRTRRFTVSGIFLTNMEEYDDTYVFTDMYTVQKLNGWAPDETSGYEITINDFDQLAPVTNRIASRVNRAHVASRGLTYGTFNIRELAPHTFSWLDVLDMNVLMIIILMIGVSAFTIVSGVLIIMLEHRQMIGLFKALGATNSTIRRVFLHFASMLIGKGIIIGNIIGIGICLLQQYFQIVGLDASVYYVDYAPVLMSVSHIIIINVITILITSIVIFGSSHAVSCNNPVKSLSTD